MLLVYNKLNKFLPKNTLEKKLSNTYVFFFTQVFRKMFK